MQKATQEQQVIEVLRNAGGYGTLRRLNELVDFSAWATKTPEASDGTFWCHTESDVYGGGLNSAGNTVKEAKDDLTICLEDARQDYVERGGKPYDVTFEYKYDLQSFFDYFSFLNVSEIAKRAGINPSLMRQYTSGIKNAGEKTYSRLSECIANITKELQAASFC